MAATKSRSSQSGSAVLAEMRETLKQGWPAGLTLLTGEDLYHLDAAQRALLQSLVSDRDAEYGLTVYGDRKIDATAVVSAARSLGMFAERRVVLVRDAEALDGEPASLAEYSARPPANSYLIVRAPKLDRRRKIAQTLVKAGTVRTFQVPRQTKSAARDVLQIAKGKGMQVASDAALFLLEICGGDLYRVDGELEKIRCWLGPGKRAKVDTEVVREVAAGTGLLSGWEVANAVLSRDRAGALEALRRILDSGAQPLLLLGGLAHRARSMLKAKLLMESGMNSARAASAARLWGVDPEAVSEGLARYSVADVVAFPSKLFQADRTLKSRALAPDAVLGSLIDQLTGVRDAGARTP